MNRKEVEKLFYLKKLDDVGNYLDNLGFMSRQEFHHWASESSDHDDFDIRLISVKPFENDRLTCFMKISKEKIGFRIKGYNAIKLSIPTIPVVKKVGFDSLELDQRLSKLEWNLPFLYFKEQTGAMDAYLQLVGALSADDLLVRDIAHLLALKYIRNTMLESDLNPGISRTEYETGLRVDLTNSLEDIRPIQAYHLLCGRAVARLHNSTLEGITWARLTDGDLEEYPGFDLIRSMKQQGFRKPVTVENTRMLLTKLFDGELSPASFFHNGKLVHGYITCDPLRKQFLVFDSKRKWLGEQPKQSLIKIPPLQVRRPFKRRRF